MKNLLFLLPLLTVPAAYADWGGMGYGHMGYSGTGGVVMFMGMGLFWGLLILGGVWMFRQMNLAKSDSPSPDEAIRIVKQRYAKGEITDAEMATMIEKLQ